MAKAIRAAVAAAFVVFIAAGAVMGFTTQLLTAGGALTAAGMAVMTFGTTLLSAVIGGMTSKGMNATGGNFGTKFAARAPTAPRQIVSGS